MTERIVVGDMSKQGSHFWFMSIQGPNGAGGFYLNSYQGTRTPKRGATRLELFNSIRQEVSENDPLSQSGVVIAFDIQPNKL
ncbi:hypothetical protein [Streptomyces sp. NPDC046859]|uniref:hypothetical protein n=1 Tax=Streptomyces sp. NPDC046859 TaxID=3155734 RepID=UPI0033ED4E75